MHNMVNGEIGKKIWSYDEVIKKYEQVYNKKIILDSNNDTSISENFTNSEDSLLYKKNIITYILLFFIILLIINLSIMIYKSYSLKK